MGNEASRWQLSPDKAAEWRSDIKRALAENRLLPFGGVKIVWTPGVLKLQGIRQTSQSSHQATNLAPNPTIWPTYVEQEIAKFVVVVRKSAGGQVGKGTAVCSDHPLEPSGPVF